MDNEQGGRDSKVAANIAGELTEALKQRLESHFLLAYLIALATNNYKFIVVLLSGEPYRKSFDYIESVLYPSTRSQLTHLLLIPACAAAFFTLAWPPLNSLINAARLKAKRVGDKALTRARQQQIVPIDEQARFFEEWESFNVVLKKRLDDNDSFHRLRNTSMERRVTSLQKSLEVLCLQACARDLQVDPTELAALKSELSRSGGVYRKVNFRTDSELAVLIKYLLKNYIDTQSDKQATVDYALASQIITRFKLRMPADEFLVKLWALGLLVEYDHVDMVGSLAPAASTAVQSWLD